MISFENNTGSRSGGITFVNTKLIFKEGSNSLFTKNRGRRGGAMAFYAQSHIVFISGITNLTFMNNHASIVGGAIYVQDSDYERIGRRNYHTQFFFNIPNSNKKPTFHFSNNTAIQAGDALYGGGGNANDIKFNNTASTGWSIAATIPFRICRCKNSKPKCNHRSRYNRTEHTNYTLIYYQGKHSILRWWQWDTGMVQYLQTSMQCLDTEWKRNSLKLNKYKV